jgi:hypothetical protein
MGWPAERGRTRDRDATCTSMAGGRPAGGPAAASGAAGCVAAAAGRPVGGPTAGL